ncbi:amidohydrolase family protein [Tothia fuscella]|uniref:Amidohydrolase family protein n=1 Tax=Tothia fuscella TaxID=1048955 RepID=A0A9P4U095_9PEZI|nr:amidohydrolase family protein [Tothia fuscella]
MLSARTLCFLSSSIIAALIAFAATFSQKSSAKTYCYKSITLDSDLAKTDKAPNCFTVSADGLFSRVFYRNGVYVEKSHVIPGLWDGHGHLLQYGELLQSVNLFGVQSLNEAIERIRSYTRQHPGLGTSKEWIRGVGWDQAAFGRYPIAIANGTKADLEADSELKGKKIMIDRIDVHCIWVSQAVLDLLPNALPQVPGGEIITNPGPGVFCDNAMDIVLQYWPKPNKEKKTEFVKAAMQELNKVGLVGMHDAGVTPSDLRLYKELADTDIWTVRVYAMLECETRNTFCEEDAHILRQEDGKGSLLKSRSVKLFADGALGSWGSAMIEPYADRPSMSGSLLVNASTLSSLARTWAGIGYQVNIHAIGDLANRLAIDAMGDAYDVACPHLSAKDCQREYRFRIEHAQIIHPDDQERIFHLGIIPSIQPTHATSDFPYAEDRLGKERTQTEAYRMRSLLSLNPVLGSDFPVEPPNPFEGIFAAVTRKSPKTGMGKNGNEEGWYTEETLSLSEALRGFTTAPAHAAFMDGQAGIIRKGAFADWVVLDSPLESLDPDQLRDLQVKATWVKGRQVYRRT